jgi:glycolate oxidase FAD binding subunit
MISAPTIEEKLRSLVGADHVRVASFTDTVGDLQAKFVVEPGNEQELAAVLRCANEAGVSVIPRGGGTKLEWGNPPKSSELILSSARLNKILEHAWADLTVTVEAGCTLQSLQDALAVHGQRLALDALWRERATIGGIISTNDSGTLRLRFGALRDLIIGVSLALPDGTLASSGGKVVKNVAGYDLPKLSTGAFGTLGVITRAVFRLHPLPRGVKTLSFTAVNLEEMQKRVLAIQDSKLAHTSLQIRCHGEVRPVGDILFEATAAGLLAQEVQLQNLLGPARAEESPQLVWSARQELWSPPSEKVAVAKISVLPAEVAKTIHDIDCTAKAHNAQWKAVLQATGIGWLRLEGEPAALKIALETMRADFEHGAGSFVILRRPKNMTPLDAWGSSGDAIPLMRAVKHQLDPNGTLNPGRFVGGI